MRIYSFVWGITVSVALTSACFVLAVSGGLLQMVAVGVVMAFFAGFLAFACAEGRDDRWTWVRRGAVWSSVCAAVADAFTVTWGGPGAGMAATLILASPVLVAPARAQFVAWSCRRSGGPLESLASRDLRRRWDWTTAEMRHPSVSATRRIVLVEERRRILDELQRRDPEQFVDWLPFAVPDQRPDRQRPRGR